MDRNKHYKKKKKTPSNPNANIRRKRRNGVPNALKSNEVFNISPYSMNSNSSHSILNGDTRDLRNWGLPAKIINFYASKGINKLFDWQVECLNAKVLEGRNLVYSAPTSAGKSMVSDILLYKQLLENKRKAVIILPFVSVTQEKMLFLKKVLKSVGVRIDAFAGNVNPRGGLKRVDVAVCTIEKANNMINRLIEDKKLNEIGLLVVDELHMVGDSSRGYLLELLLTKVIYLNRKFNYGIQIVGMSATVSNLDMISKWLNAELYVTSFRPIPLYERIKIDDVIYDLPEMSEYKRLNISELGITGEDAYVVYLAIDTMIRGHGALIFCATKAMCEKLSRNIATDIYEFGRGRKPQNDRTKEILGNLMTTLDTAKIGDILQQLQRSSAGLDKTLEATVKFGVAYHHAGLSLDERSIVENAFRFGTIKILCATSTLSAGVNLPARLVIIKSPFDYKGSVMDVMTYRQMIGRAGRQGVDTMGESILICSLKDELKAKQLIQADFKPIYSCLVKKSSSNSNDTPTIVSSSGLRRGILEIIANESANNYDDLLNYISCTLFASNSTELTKSVIQNIIKYLVDYKLIHYISDIENNGQRITSTQFGKAVLASGISPEEGLFIMEELNKAKQNICISNDLHLLYEVTPTYLSDQMDTIDWQHYLDIWTKLDDDMQRVGHLIGIRDFFIIQMRNNGSCDNESRQKLSIHRRFYTTLALYDLIQEMPLSEVANKFKCSKGILQSLQQSASSFAGMLTVFCNKLGWHNLEILIEQFQSRLYFGVQRELVDLMRISCLNASIARLLYNKKHDTVASLASVSSDVIEQLLLNSGPFDKNKEVSESVIWIPSQCKSMNVKEIANLIVLEARELIEKDLGVKIDRWNSQSSQQTKTSDEVLLSSFSSDEINSQIVNFSMKGADYPENASIESISLVNSDNSYVKQCHNKFDTNYSVMQSSPMIVSPDQSLSEKTSNDMKSQNFTSIDKFVSSTPIKSTPLFERKDFMTEKNDSNRQNTGTTYSFGDSLEFACVSWERIENISNNDKHYSNIEDNDSPIHKRGLDHIDDDDSPIEVQLLTRIVTSSKNIKESDSGCMKINSKRTSNPSPSCKMLEPQNKKAVTSSVSLFNSDDSLFMSSDSMETCISDRTPSLDSFDLTEDLCLNAMVPNLRFTELKNYEKFNIVIVDTKNLQLIDSLIEKWSIKRGIALHCVVEKRVSQPKQIIGAKVKSLHIKPKESEGIDMNHNDLVLKSMTVCFEGENTVYFISSTDVLRLLTSQLKYKLQKNSKIITFDIKLTYQILRKLFEIDETMLNSIDWFDVRIAHWMFNPEVIRPNNIRELNSIYLKQYDYLLNSVSDSKDINSYSTGLLFPLINTLSDKLIEANLYYSYKRVEIPSRFTIANMELNGIGVDYDYIKKQRNLLSSAKTQLEAKAYTISGKKFKLSNPTDIAKILYEDLNLLSHYFKAIKKPNPTRSGLRSNTKLPKHLGTSKPVLERLATLSENPLPGVVLEWRRVDNAIKKSIDPILQFAYYRNDSNMYRINGQSDDWSSTGRISMYDPNLIGIAKDFQITDITLDEVNCGSNETILFSLRRTFVAKDGYTLVSADFSQLELRILAHLSRDKDLCNILNEGGDVFKSIASVWKSKPIDSITSEERQRAKQISYGMIYGIGAKSLSEQLEVSEEEASEFMETFINKYNGVKEFMEKTIDSCREHGLVETINGRKRFLPHINSSNGSSRAQAERQAVNTRIQGSAADLVKTAMIAVDNVLVINKHMSARIVLQMHDELMYEVSNQCCNEFAKLLSLSMQNSSKKFTVNLPVVVKMGPNWGQLVPV